MAEHVHPLALPPDPADGEIQPCIRTTIVGESLATFEAFDLTEGDIVPCIRVETEMLPGALGAVAVAIDPELRSFTVQVRGTSSAESQGLSRTGSRRTSERHRYW